MNSPAAPLRIPGLRWWIIALIASGMALNYLARNSLAVAAPTLTGAMRLSAQQYSYVIAGFQFTYVVMQPIAGYILDFLGTRLGLFLFAGAWAIANMLHSLAVNWWQLTLCRGLLGAAEASVIPANLKVVGEWFPAKERSIATGWFNIGASVGAMLAPPLVVWCIRAYDWRFAFLVTGGLGLLWSGLWYASYRKPDTHFAITEAERDFIRRGQSKGPNDSNTRVYWRDITASRSFWGLALGRFFAEPAWNTFTFWIPLYFTTVRGMDMKAVAAFAWLPFLAADLGSVLGGYLSPLYLKYFNVTLLTSRKLVALSGALLMAGPAFIGLAAAPGVAIGLFCVGGFAHQVLSGAILTTSSDVFPSHQLATANGLMGSAAWTGGLLFSLVVGGLATTLGYNPLFACLVGFDLLGVALFWWLVKPQDGPI
jgi:ACS family hexuronate transporter-like MFS transporter